jgi:hypothetical protein
MSLKSCSRLLIENEKIGGRITLVLVGEALGF